MTLTRPYIWMGLAVVAAPAFAWLVYRLAQGLGFLEPPRDRQHELRRTIVLAIYSFLLFLPVLIYGFEKRWPGAWIVFGVVDGLALLFFAGSGIWAGRALWKLRHPEPAIPLAVADADADADASEPAHSGLADSAPHSGPTDELPDPGLAGSNPDSPQTATVPDPDGAEPIVRS